MLVLIASSVTTKIPIEPIIIGMFGRVYKNRELLFSLPIMLFSLLSWVVFFFFQKILLPRNIQPDRIFIIYSWNKKLNNKNTKDNQVISNGLIVRITTPHKIPFHILSLGVVTSEIILESIKIRAAWIIQVVFSVTANRSSLMSTFKFKL